MSSNTPVLIMLGLANTTAFVAWASEGAWAAAALAAAGLVGVAGLACDTPRRSR